MRRLIAILMLMAAIGFAADRLPDEGLKRAQEAEKLLKANQVDEAVQILRKLDKDFPGHAAISLRIAQIMDTNNQYGPALFYYRRYMHIKGRDADLDAHARVASIEMVAGAKEAAEAFAKKLGETTEPVKVPTPEVKHSLERPATDGSLVPVTKPEDLNAAEVTPLPRQTEDNEPKRAVLTPLGGQSPMVVTSESGSPEPTPLAPETGRTATPPPPQIRVDTTPAEPTPDASAPVSGASSREPGFFQVSRGQSRQATVKITNSVRNSVLTFAAFSDVQKPVNVVLMTGESRELSVPPGKYEVTVNVTENGYVPTTVLDKKFNQTFEAGKIYSKRVTGSGME